jgi:ClpP class serine protease
MDTVSTVEKAPEELDESKVQRLALLKQLEDYLGQTVIAYFTSQTHPVSIDPTDADMLEEVLRQTTFHNGLCLLVDTPGGDGVSAERIVRVCRVYSDNRFEVLVARRAKSAGTIIALGSNKIIMGETSALGRIDPQVVVKEKDGTQTMFPAHVIVTCFDELLGKAATSTSGTEVYLQQLGNYDTNQIESIRRQFQMTEDIAVKCLKQGMMAALDEVEIRKKAILFTTPTVTKSHSRDIFFEEAHAAGLNVELLPHDSPAWKTVCDYYAMGWDFVTSKDCKLIESTENHFSLPWTS